MRKITLVLLLLISCISFAFAQDNISGPIIQTPVYFDVSPPLRDIVKNLPVKAETSWKDGIIKNKFNMKPKPQGQVPGGLSDPSLQNTDGLVAADTTIVNFDGNYNMEGVYPPDTHGDVGPNHYFQVVNSHYSIYSKTGTLLLGPLFNNSVFTGFSNNSNDGDAVVLYDEQADRWLFSQFSLPNFPNGPFYQMIAVSQTGDPTGSWYRYQYSFTDMPDYPKFGVWGDAYYMSMNRFTSGSTNWNGPGAVAFNRILMLAGSPAATMVMFTKPSTDESGSFLPSDCDGPFPAGNPPNYFTYLYDGSTGDHLGVYEFHVDWTTPANSTFTNFLSLPVNAFTATVSGATQPGTSVKLDALSDRLMYRLQYRSFPGYATMVCNHTVDISTSVLGIRWYELRKTTGAWTIYQQGTYSIADAKSRWMASIAMDSSGNMAMGYSISGSSQYRSIRYTGRKKNDALNQMTIAEKGIFNGTGSQTGSAARWGDYSAMSCDPSAKATFWYTTEYLATTSSNSWRTRIASFRFANTPVVSTLAATLVTANNATLNGSVNPNGLLTNYYFEWGMTTAYGSTSSTTSAGTGTSGIAVSANISSLIPGTTYHFRLVAVNSDGTSNGNDLTFVPGGATVSTTAATAITLTTASAGGNVMSDGGSPVTARGVCWSTSTNPTILGDHTTDGSGLGVFLSSITGLVSNATYHLRSYATNANGTFYGEDIPFTTLCGVYTLPFTESFTNTVIPNCWTIADNQGSGQVWQFGVITGQSPNPSLTGNYAYLDSDSYGSGSSQNADMVTPTLNLANFSSITIQFNHYFKSISGSSGTLSYSINNGTTWTSIATFTTTSATNPVTFSQVIAAVAGQSSVKFKWNYTGTYGWYWGIDDISITGISIGPPIVTTTAASSITMNTATAGGNVTSGGLSAVSARGVCWGTAANPTIAGSHTTDGSGTGIFTSSITGLVANTPYHLRAYATNAEGTSYGDDLIFKTLCETVNTFPWNEGFETGGQIPNCWTQEQVNSSGINWTFITGSGNNNPVTAHTGTYNACLKDVTSADNKTKLITPALNLSSLPNPQLKFWHTQAYWDPDQDQLSIFYKTSVGEPWTLLITYTASITTWTMETITLPAASATYFIAFEGNAKYGRGVCIDDVEVSSSCASILPVSISITASANPVSPGFPVTFTAVPVNGGASPVYQWKVNGNNAGTNNISYTYTPSTGDAVSCKLTAGEVCTSSNPATSNTITMVVNTVPATASLQNFTVTNIQCYDALQTVTVAGNGNFFNVQSGGTATVIAGQNIFLYPGVIVSQGGTMYGYIAPGGPFCPSPTKEPTAAGNISSMQESDNSFFRVYPNPTSGEFTVALTGYIPSGQINVVIYDMKGEMVQTTTLINEMKHQFSLAGLPSGLYLVRVEAANQSGSLRIVKVE